MAVIESPEYEATRKRLEQDPAIEFLATGLLRVPLEQIAHEDGTPRFEFMQAANAKYREHSADPAAAKHIGAVAEVLIRVRNRMEAQVRKDAAGYVTHLDTKIAAEQEAGAGAERIAELTDLRNDMQRIAEGPVREGGQP